MAEHVQARFGKKLRALRKRQGWTQETLAHKLGLDRTYLSDVENGRMNVSLVNLEIIAQGFGKSLSQLLSGV
ncbi:MAG: XRE family transcriptional regulator [Candidatus Angelobacter sp. Gp1-AA117]|nr:MAG: XRE family transcriptional regulator [Candidatus Angelobacter sp. Gp1-AA117]